MQFIATILTTTPYWVWLILLFLIARGLRSTTTREISIKKLFLFPAIFFVLGILKLAHEKFSQPALTGIIIGATIGFIVIKLINPAKKTVRLPDGEFRVVGQWLSLCLMMMLFFANYADAVLTAINPAIAANPLFIAGHAMINGFSISAMIFRAIAHIKTPLSGGHPHGITSHS